MLTFYRHVWEHLIKQLERELPLPTLVLSWAAKELKLSYCNKETLLFAIHPYYGKLIHVPQQQSSKWASGTSTLPITHQALGVRAPWIGTATLESDLLKSFEGVEPSIWNNYPAFPAFPLLLMRGKDHVRPGTQERMAAVYATTSARILDLRGWVKAVRSEVQVWTWGVADVKAKF